MTLETVILLLFVFQCETVSIASDDADSGKTPVGVFGELGQNATLPCHDLAVNVTPLFTKWLKHGSVVAKRNHTSQFTPKPSHYSILDNGDLHIPELKMIDGGSYECECSSQDSIKDHDHTEVILQIASGPDEVIIEISPTAEFPNGTHYVRSGSDVHFKCSTLSASYPSRTLSLIFQNTTTERKTLVFGQGSLVQFEVLPLTQDHQGFYTCSAENSISKRTITKTMQLLVFYPPVRDPECTWEFPDDPSLVVFKCSWPDSYPEPTLEWSDVTSDKLVLATGVNNTLEVMLNRSRLSDSQELRCSAKHVTFAHNEERSCHFKLRAPYPEVEPLQTTIEGSNMTLSCTELQSIPPAKLVWLRTVEQKSITPGAKYIIEQEGPTSKLTIINASKEDEGTYFCKTENPIDVRESEIYLTVKSSLSYAGGIVGTFLSALILGLGIAVGKVVYSNRDRVCLGHGFGVLSEERNDVLNLVDSDDEENIFQDAVPRLPVLPNGHSTTLVEIHHIPSSDLEEHETTEGSQDQRGTNVAEE